MDSNESDLENFYLELTKEPVKFESVSSLTNVFFDDSKQQVRIYLNNSIVYLFNYSIYCYIIFAGICC